MWTEHRCVKCSELHEFTNLRRLYSGLIVAGILFVPPLLEGVIASQGIRIVLIASLLFTLLSIIPGQHKLSSNEDVGVK